MKTKIKQFFRAVLRFLGIVNPHNTYDEAVEALNKLYSSRTGKVYGVSSRGDSDAERVTLLWQRIYEEKIWPVFKNILQVQTAKKQGRSDPENTFQLRLADIVGGVITTAEICLNSPPEAEILRRGISDLEEGSAHYDINTNQKFPFGSEDLFRIISQMERRFIWDVNSNLPKTRVDKHAFILGQTFDHEDNFWLRSEVKSGNENIFAFGVTSLFGRDCFRIQRLRKNVVTALYKQRNNIPDAIEYYYSTESRLAEVRVILESYKFGKKRLIKEISDLQPYCTGSFHISLLTARRCAALLLHEDAPPKLKLKVDEEWKKFKENHPNVLGDTQLIQNALYFNAEILTRDEGAKQMARYCGLKPVNEFLVCEA